jgi:hypothetical protein
MAQQFRIKRTYATVAIVAGGFATVDLPRGYDYESVHIRAYGTVNVTTAATSVRIEAPVQAISRVELVADGRNTLFSAPFWFATFGKYDRSNMLDSGARVVTPPTSAAVGSYPFEANGVVDLMTPDGERPKDSNFRTDGLQLFQLRLTFGNPIDMFVPGAGVATYTAANVEISTVEMVEMPDANGQRTTPVALKKVSFQEIAVPTTNANQEIRLPAGNMIKSVVLRTEGGVTAGEPGATVLNRVSVFSGVDVRLNELSAALRGQNNNDYGQITAGYYIADLARCGGSTARLSELWDVTRQAEPKISMDITGSATVKAQAVVTEYLALNQG